MVRLTTEEIEQTKYEDKFNLIGRKIIGIRWLTKEESDSLFGWYHQPIAIMLDDGTQLIPQSDDEGNDAGVIHILPFDLEKETDIMYVQRF
jgi:hypothetical protein